MIARVPCGCRWSALALSEGRIHWIGSALFFVAKYRELGRLTFCRDSRYYYLVMHIHLTNSIWLGNIDPFLRSIDLSDINTLHISAHKRWISVHPMVLAMVAALSQTVSPSHITCDTFEARSAHYFERMGLFRFLGIHSGIVMQEHEPSGRFIPLRQIRTASEQSALVVDVVPLLHLEPRYAEPIRYIVSELLRNVIEHAQSPHGAFVAAQYYPKSNTIRLGIADTGIGIRQSLSHAHVVSDDIQALRLALTPGITGTTARDGGTTENAGAGLFFIKSIAAVNGDFFALYSAHAFYKLLHQKGKRTLHADPFADRHSVAQEVASWPGTVVGIDMKLDETENFSLLLDHIRVVYGEAVRERKRSKFKAPQFI